MGGMLGTGELEALLQTLHPHGNFHFLFEQKRFTSGQNSVGV